jgi:hypothetical protein
MGCKRIALFSAKVDHLLLCCEKESCFGPKGYGLTEKVTRSGGWMMIPDHDVIFSVRPLKGLKTLSNSSESRIVTADVFMCCAIT